MKFRYKVLITNLILLSVSLGLVGYLMIHKNFELAKETQISNAVIQNNLVQSSVEYEVLQALNREESVKGTLPDIGAQVSSGMRAENVTFFIYYGDKLVYNETEENANLKKVWEAQQEDGNKNYAIFEEDGHYYIYVTAASKVGDENLCMISRSDVSDAYALRDREIRYFRLILFVCLMIESLLIYVISRYLTRPLEQLNRVAEEITDGSYETRITVKSQDEVGLLALSYIFSEGRRLERMSGKLFDLIYLREHEMEKEAVQVENVSSEVLKVVTPSLAAKGLLLKENIEPAVLYGNKELLVTALVNLLDNARKASKEHGVIEFSGKRIQEEENPFYYELSVKDYGIGMTKEETERICDEFYMADKSRARQEGGAGIGMSLVALILEHHQAELIVESEPKKGTKMRICFRKEQN
jgi:two-component system OmpR family sensor kinase